LTKVSLLLAKALPFQYRPLLTWRTLMLTCCTPAPPVSPVVPQKSPVAGVVQPAFQLLVP
jgi:hypothetical protein